MELSTLVVILGSAISCFISVGAILIGVGMSKGELSTAKEQIATLTAHHSDDVKHLQEQIYDCVSRDQFDKALSELRHDVKRLIEMVAKLT